MAEWEGPPRGRRAPLRRRDDFHTEIQKNLRRPYSPLRLAARKVLLTCAWVVLISPGVWASGPWTEKSYQQWDNKDLHRILHDSPWVKRFTLTRVEVPESSLPGDTPTGLAMWHYPSTATLPEDTHSLPFTVRWVSSRTLREAWARRLVLQKKVPENEIEKHVPPSQDEFELAVEGPDMTPFHNVRESALKSKCYLSVDSKRVAPTRVVLVHAKEGEVKGILFYFPKKNSTGEPIISSHERSVGFVERGGGVDIHVNFNPQTMVDQAGIDL